MSGEVLSIKDQVDRYVQSLTTFVTEHDIPGDWFRSPDHFAIKLADAVGYERQVRLAKSLAVMGKVSEIKLNGRRLATAQLETPQQVGPFGAMEWLEIMEPRPEKVGKGKVGLDHMEFYFDDFKQITGFLTYKGLKFENEGKDNPSHKWVSVPFGDDGMFEVKFNDNPLAKVVAHEVEEGIASWV